MKKGIIIFVEGETEVEIFKLIKSFLRKKVEGETFKVRKIITKNVRGIGNFKSKPYGICKDILNQNPNIDFDIFICYDTDVFGISPKPPINWDTVIGELETLPIGKVYKIKANKSIEDWLICDKSGVLNFLKLPKNTKLKGISGYEKLCKLFKQKDKVYNKGSKVKGFVESLNIELITCKNCDQLKSLCRVLELNCEKIKKRT